MRDLFEKLTAKILQNFETFFKTFLTLSHKGTFLLNKLAKLSIILYETFLFYIADFKRTER